LINDDPLLVRGLEILGAKGFTTQEGRELTEAGIVQTVGEGVDIVHVAVQHSAKLADIVDFGFKAEGGQHELQNPPVLQKLFGRVDLLDVAFEIVDLALDARLTRERFPLPDLIFLIEAKRRKG
jgi:hypothetical protein